METNTVGEIILAKMKEAKASKRHVSIHSGIPYTTLTRKLANGSDLTLKEIANIAHAIDLKLGDVVKSYVDRNAA